MISFSRTLLVGGELLGQEAVLFHGILEDNIYAMEIQMNVNPSSGIIAAIQGQMKRYTTPVCPRAVDILQNAVGISLRDEGWISRINREVGQKGCQHFAEILIECGRCLTSVLLTQAMGEAHKQTPEGSAHGITRSWVKNHPEVQGSCIARPHGDLQDAP